MVDHGKSFTAKRVVLNIILGLKVLPETKMFNYIDANINMVTNVNYIARGVIYIVLQQWSRNNTIKLNLSL